MLGLDVPVDPEPPEATRWLVEELAKPEYQRAQPTAIDLVGRAILDWFGSLFSGADGAPPIIAILLGLVIAAALIVIAVVVWGRLRRNRRAEPGRALFGDDERRSPSELRAAAASAAARGDWTAAIADAYRAIAAEAAERDIVEVVPGMTARVFAAQAGIAFPDAAAELMRAAGAFDNVRYLGGTGDSRQYDEVASLGARLGATRPVWASA